mgnify:CR=1 FL=1
MPMNGSQPSSLQDADWKVPLERISRGKCTPFIGGEANMGSVPAEFNHRTRAGRG